jgi:UDPglucose 6-dehydrogenase
LIITDPKTLNNAMIDLEGIEGKITYAENPYESSAGCDAIAFMTEWEIYASLNYEKIYRSMSKPAFIFDGRNILDHKRLFEIGFNVFPIGKTALTHFS